MITILITGAGAPGTLGTIRMLRENRDKEDVRIIGTDMRVDVATKFMVDKFYQIPAWDDMAYIMELFRVCSVEKVDVIIPQNTMELQKLSSYRWESMNYMLDDADVIHKANNKHKLIREASKLGISVPKTQSFFYDSDLGHTNNLSHFMLAAGKVGYGFDSPIVVKPPVGHGSRGIRILHGHIDYSDRWTSKPDSLHTAMEDAINWFQHVPPTGILVQEYLPGPEYTIDVMITPDDGMAIVRRRDRIVSGISHEATVIDHPLLRDTCIQLSRHLGLTYPHGYQFKEDKNGIPKLLECNPRVQGTMIASHYAGWNIVWDGVRMAIDEEVNFNLSRERIRYNFQVLRFSDTIAN